MMTSRKTSDTEWMTVGAAGRKLGRSRLAVLSMIVRGELAGEDRGGFTFVRSDTVDAALARRESEAA